MPTPFAAISDNEDPVGALARRVKERHPGLSPQDTAMVVDSLMSKRARKNAETLTPADRMRNMERVRSVTGAASRDQIETPGVGDYAEAVGRGATMVPIEAANLAARNMRAGAGYAANGMGMSPEEVQAEQAPFDRFAQASREFYDPHDSGARTAGETFGTVMPFLANGPLAVAAATAGYGLNRVGDARAADMSAEGAIGVGAGAAAGALVLGAGTAAATVGAGRLLAPMAGNIAARGAQGVVAGAGGVAINAADALSQAPYNENWKDQVTDPFTNGVAGGIGALLGAAGKPSGPAHSGKPTAPVAAPQQADRVVNMDQLLAPQPNQAPFPLGAAESMRGNLGKLGEQPTSGPALAERARMDEYTRSADAQVGAERQAADAARMEKRAASAQNMLEDAKFFNDAPKENVPQAAPLARGESPLDHAMSRIERMPSYLDKDPVFVADGSAPTPATAMHYALLGDSGGVVPPARVLFPDLPADAPANYQRNLGVLRNMARQSGVDALPLSMLTDNQEMLTGKLSRSDLARFMNEQGLDQSAGKKKVVADLPVPVSTPTTKGIPNGQESSQGQGQTQALLKPTVEQSPAESPSVTTVPPSSVLPAAAALPAPVKAPVAKPIAKGDVEAPRAGEHVVYHGTSKAGFTNFDPYSGEYGLFGGGTYTTKNPGIAATYMGKGKGGSPGLYEAKLTVKNPMDMDAPADIGKWKAALAYDSNLSNSVDLRGATTNESVLRRIEDEMHGDMATTREDAQEIVQDIVRGMGHDSITHIGGGRRGNGESHRVYIAFDPEQIQSAKQIPHESYVQKSKPIAEPVAPTPEPVAKPEPAKVAVKADPAPVKATKAAPAREFFRADNGVREITDNIAPSYYKDAKRLTYDELKPADQKRVDEAQRRRGYTGNRGAAALPGVNEAKAVARVVGKAISVPFKAAGSIARALGDKVGVTNLDILGRSKNAAAQDIHNKGRKALAAVDRLESQYREDLDLSLDATRVVKPGEIAAVKKDAIPTMRGLIGDSPLYLALNGKVAKISAITQKVVNGVHYAMKVTADMAAASPGLSGGKLARTKGGKVLPRSMSSESRAVLNDPSSPGAQAWLRGVVDSPENMFVEKGKAPRPFTMDEATEHFRTNREQADQDAHVGRVGMEYDRMFKYVPEYTTVNGKLVSMVNVDPTTAVKTVFHSTITRVAFADNFDGMSNRSELEARFPGVKTMSSADLATASKFIDAFHGHRVEDGGTPDATNMLETANAGIGVMKTLMTTMQAPLELFDGVSVVGMAPTGDVFRALLKLVMSPKGVYDHARSVGALPKDVANRLNLNSPVAEGLRNVSGFVYRAGGRRRIAEFNRVVAYHVGESFGESMAKRNGKLNGIDEAYMETRKLAESVRERYRNGTSTQEDHVDLGVRVANDSYGTDSNMATKGWMSQGQRRNFWGMAFRSYGEARVRRIFRTADAASKNYAKAKTASEKASAVGVGLRMMLENGAGIGMSNLSNKYVMAIATSGLAGAKIISEGEDRGWYKPDSWLGMLAGIIGGGPGGTLIKTIEDSGNMDTVGGVAAKLGSAVSAPVMAATKLYDTAKKAGSTFRTSGLGDAVGGVAKDLVPAVKTIAGNVTGTDAVTRNASVSRYMKDYPPGFKAADTRSMKYTDLKKTLRVAVMKDDENKSARIARDIALLVAKEKRISFSDALGETKEMIRNMRTLGKISKDRPQDRRDREKRLGPTVTSELEQYDALLDRIAARTR